MNAQLVAHLSTYVIGHPYSDSFEVLWQLSWVKNAIFQQGVSPLFAPSIYYPHGWYLASGAQPVWWMMALSPLTLILGAIATYNLTVLATLVIGAWGVFLLMQHFSRSFLAGLVAGCVYVFAPVLAFREGGHLHILLGMQWLPYLALFSHKSLEDKARRRYWLGAGVFLALTILGHWQFLLMAPLVPLCVIAFAKAPLRWLQRAALMLRIGFVALILLAPFALHAKFARDQMFTDTSTFPIVEQDAFSLSLDRLFVPNPIHPLWGKWSRQQFPIGSEADMVSISYAALGLALIGALKGLSARRAYLILSILAIILALGITLHWNAQRVAFSLPAQMAAVVRNVEGKILGPELLPPDNQVLIPLPIAFLVRLLPLFNEARVWARYAIIAMLGVAALGGLGTEFLVRRWPRTGNWLVGGLLLIVLAENLTMPYRYFTEVSSNTRPIDLWLASQPKSMSLIEYPVQSSAKLALYRQSLHGQNVANGFMSKIPTYYSQALPQLGEWPNLAALPILRGWDVQYVLVNGTNDEQFTKVVLPSLQSLTGLCLVREDNEPDQNLHTYLYRISAGGQVCE
jgi:hypothetical protein